MFIQGATGYWELVIGLEVHAQLKTEHKLFSNTKINFGEENNTQVSFVDCAMPGMLPVLNEECVKLAIKAGVALKGKINEVSVFDRKNYFYPDSPQGYQITQFFFPIVNEGEVDIIGEDGNDKKIKINRIHIEQDAGKSIHDQSPTETFVDLNRVGIALIEIVTDPDFRDTNEVTQFMKKLRNILKYTNVCDGDLEKGSMRCDANVSIRKKGEVPFGTRVEIKNLNSFKNITKAIMYEANRQIGVVENGEKVVQETRLYDVSIDETKSMRKKEEAHDYRYFPDPDLLPLRVTKEYIEEIKNTLPELPDHKKDRYLKDFGITDYDADVIIAEKNTAEFFEYLAEKVNPKLTANWMCAELFGRLNKRGVEFKNSTVSKEHFLSLLLMIDSNEISGKIGKEVLDRMFEANIDPKEIVVKYNLVQISDVSEIEKIIDEVLLANPDKVTQFKSGKDKLFGFFIGQIMKISNGKANPNSVNKILTEKLKS
ncbi:MAG: aspartyl-tRNA(Asn)/glutamyl-tRNA(Gln) amidotransferase subunit B [Candidatus Midichloriaceae bacterium]|jgi:aspartyl-tRNA(Asn)/glutamyl-tRNA(Gln) amidotransferase subunit B